MANTKSTTKPKIEESSNLEQENDNLKAQIEEMQSQMQMMMAQMAMLNMQQPKQEPKKDRKITFVNMTKGSLVLKGTQFWTIDGQFNSRTFSEKEARVIVDNMDKGIRAGSVYITDTEFIEENELSDAYVDILSVEDLKNLFDKDSKYIISVYKTVSDSQKKVIIDMIVDMKMNGVSVDGNVLVELGKLCGKDLVGIEPLEE